MCGVLFWFFQGFPNSCKGWEEWKTLLGRGGFFIRWWEPEEKWFRPFEPFPKLETTFCKNWTSTKIKISMICVYKEYKVKIKMALEQWLQLKNMFLLGYSMKNSGGMEERVFDLWWGGIKIWLGGESTGGCLQVRGGGWKTVLLVGGLRHPPSRENSTMCTLMILCLLFNLCC